MHKLQVQGVHHITLTGAGRETTIDFQEGVPGMPFIFEQPDLDDPDEGHLCFDPGDGRLITVFASEARRAVHRRTPTDPGSMHHLAFNVGRATFSQAPARPKARGIPHSGPKDRGFMDSIHFTDPLGLLIELVCYRFEPPQGRNHADVMIEAHRERVARGDSHIEQVHLAHAIERLVERTQSSLSENRSPRNPYRRGG